MKLCRRLLALLMVCAMCVSLCSCGVSEADVVGTWNSEYTYDGVLINKTVMFKEDGSYREVVYRDGRYARTEGGTYEINGRKVIATSDRTKASTTYKYRGGTLVNTGHEYVKQ